MFRSELAQLDSRISHRGGSGDFRACLQVSGNRGAYGQNECGDNKRNCLPQEMDLHDCLNLCASSFWAGLHSCSGFALRQSSTRTGRTLVQPSRLQPVSVLRRLPSLRRCDELT